MRRLVDTYIVRAVAAAPPLVPRPDGESCVDDDCVAPYIELQLQKSVISKNTCTSPSLLLMTLFWGYHSLYGVTVSHHITHHQAA